MAIGTTQQVRIALKKGLATNINTVATKSVALEGEPHYTTDTKKTYVFDGYNNNRVHGLDMALVSSGDIVTNQGEIVWQN